MATKRAPRQPTSVHRLKVTLLGIRPPIWRRIVVPSNMTLDRLHQFLQIAMGWHGGHLHQFQVGDAFFVDPDFLTEEGDRSERTARLAQVTPTPKTRFRYLYDFGDSWDHEILVEAVGPPEPGTRYPVCLTGKRACPPEDCGGVWGYSELLETISDPKNPEREDMLEWLGGPIDPEAFDLEEVNRRLGS